MKKSVRTTLVLLGVSLTLGAVAPDVARADDCEEAYHYCLYKAYKESRWLARQVRFVKCAVGFSACLKQAYG